ncbi:MAG: zinc-ribbon domain-containing protein [Gemmataceae bacterium]|nr:zinc-ribbon domain-containing protein [Gemmataceae bacterium]
MPILVACSCGKKLKVRDELVGKKVKCPACGGVLEVAAPVHEVVHEVVEEVVEAPPPRPARKPPGQASPPQALAGKPGKPPPLPAGAAAPPPRRDEAPDQKAADQPADRPAAQGELGVWRCNAFGALRLLCLTNEGAIYAKGDKKTIKRIEADLAAGESPQDAFGDDKPSFIPWDTVTKVESNLKASSFDIKYKAAGSDDESTESFHFEDKRERTDALKWMRDRLAPDFTYKKRELTRFQATFSPLIFLGIVVGVFTFLVFLAWALRQPGEGRARTNIWGLIVAYTVGWLGPIWTGVIGGLLAVGGLAWMAVRIADPPIEVTITPKPQEKRRNVEEEDEEEEEDRPREKGKRRRSRADDED